MNENRNTSQLCCTCVCRHEWTSMHWPQCTGVSFQRVSFWEKGTWWLSTYSAPLTTDVLQMPLLPNLSFLPDFLVTLHKFTHLIDLEFINQINVNRLLYTRASLVVQRLKHLPAMWETQVRSLDWEDPLEKEMATHSSILAWRIPWMEGPGRL